MCFIKRPHCVRRNKNVSFPRSGLGMPTLKLCLTLCVMNIKINLFYSVAHQAELGNRHSQTGVWERVIITRVNKRLYRLPTTRNPHNRWASKRRLPTLRNARISAYSSGRCCSTTSKIHTAPKSKSLLCYFLINSTPSCKFFNRYQQTVSPIKSTMAVFL